MNFVRCLIFVPVAFAMVAMSVGARAASGVEVRVDFSRTNGVIRPLHGINRGPLVAGGLIALTADQRRLKIPFTRLHDSHWPNSDVVDIHAVFPDFARTATNPESYDFRRTDEYVAAVRETGARIVYRLGESIEHDAVKRFVHPPLDAGKWADVCMGIIRHYNEGWANGFRYGIRYWEIWNEPENRPACWTGTDEQFLSLYAIASRKIKARFPTLAVGGPAFGYTGEVRAGQFVPGGLLTNFLAVCRRESLPLDFLSWHCYTDDVNDLIVRARGLRTLLDENGFTNTESHLNEWNYLPGKSWTALSKSSTPEVRRDFYQRMAGPDGAAFIVSALIELQNVPVDMCNLFHGETGPFGIFDEGGVRQKNYFALLAFAELLNTRRVATEGNASLQAIGGVNEEQGRAAVLLSNRVEAQGTVQVNCANLPWRTESAWRVRVVDAAHDLDEVTDARIEGTRVAFTLRRPAVALITIERAK